MDEHLSHYGISGMKWHRRRFQNPDGSLTPAGRERYLKNAERADTYRQKAADASLKSAKYAYKRDKIAGRRVQTDLSIGKANRMAANSSRANVRAARYERKAQRLEKANRDLNNPVNWSEKQYRRYLKKEARRVSKTDDNSSDREKFNKYASDFIDKYGSESYLKALSGGAIVNAGRNALKSMGGSLQAPANEMLFKAFVDKGRADTELRSEMKKGSGLEPPSNWKQMSSSEKGQFMNSVTDRTISGKSSGRYPEGSKETSDQMWKRLESDPGYIKVKDKSKSGNGGHALVKIENKATAATSLSYLGYSDKEIAKILGVSVEILREMK